MRRSATWLMPTRAVHQGGGDQIWQRELSLDDLRGSALVRAPELLGDSRGGGGHLHIGDLGTSTVVPSPSFPRGDGGIEDGMLRAPQA